MKKNTYKGSLFKRRLHKIFRISAGEFQRGKAWKGSKNNHALPRKSNEASNFFKRKRGIGKKRRRSLIFGFWEREVKCLYEKVGKDVDENPNYTHCKIIETVEKRKKKEVGGWEKSRKQNRAHGAADPTGRRLGTEPSLRVGMGGTGNEIRKKKRLNSGLSQSRPG